MKDYIYELLNKVGYSGFFQDDDKSLLDFDITAEQMLYVVVQFSKKYGIDLNYIYENTRFYSINELISIGESYLLI